MGLDPLEFADCLTDSPFFRKKLHEHEKELERTSKAIKSLILCGKDLLNAAKNLSKAQKTFSNNLMEFEFECIGSQQTDDEVMIAASLKEFGEYIALIEDVRDKMLEQATEQFLKPLEKFRKEHIGKAKEQKKQFDKQTAKFCQSLDRYLNLKTKINDSVLQEADATVQLEKRHFYQASMKYVLCLQEVQERKKFEFVEILLGFMYSWLMVYHQGHEVAKDCKQYMIDLQLRLQKARDSFNSTRNEAELLMTKMLEVRGTKPVDQAGTIRGFTRQGYLFLMEKKALGTTWLKYYCQYKKKTREFFMIPYSQVVGKLNLPEVGILKSCVRRASDSIEKRFCFDVSLTDSPRASVLTFQALSEEDLRLWLDAMDGKEPIYNTPAKQTEESFLDEVGFNFMKKCISAIENRGLTDQGLYRVVGVSSKVNRLTSMGLDRRKGDKLSLEEPGSYEIKTITSAVKNYLRSLPEPLMTFYLHDKFIAAAKRESKTLRIHDIHKIVHQLQKPNFEMLDLLIGHLKRLSNESDTNLMTVANLGVCFGPNLMRPEEETMAAIMDIKFCNIVVEILINNYEQIFKTPPEDGDGIDSPDAPTSSKLAVEVKEKKTPLTSANPVALTSSAAAASPAFGTPGHSNIQVQAGSTGSTNSGPHYSNQTGLWPMGKIRPRYNVSTICSNNTGQSAGPHARNLSAIDTYHGGSTSGSSESLNSHKSTPNSQSPQLDTTRRGPCCPVYSNMTSSENIGEADPVDRLSPNVTIEGTKINFSLGSGDVPTFGSIKRRTSGDSYSPSMTSSAHSMSGSLTSVPSVSPGFSRPLVGRIVRALYRCQAESDSELSFDPNDLIYDVKNSKEPGWLEGTLKGVTGLIPENYVEYINKRGFAQPCSQASE